MARSRKENVDATHEERQSLWLLVVAPSVWAVHFLACYVHAALWCAKVAGPDGALGSARTWIGAYTALALVAITLVGVVGYRRHGYGTATAPHDYDTREDRHRFLGFATLLLSGLSFVAVVYVAMSAVIVGSCR